MHIHLFYTFLHNSSEGMLLLSTIAIVEGRMRNCIFCPLSLSVMLIVCRRVDYR